MSTGVERARGLDREGIRTDRVRWNLSAAALYEEAVRRQEGLIAAEGPLVCRTGQHTGRSPNDKFVVREPSSEQHIAWGKVNRPMDPAQFDALHRDLLSSLEGKELFVQDCYAGADPAFRLPIRVITEYAWHSLFARNLFIVDPSPAAEAAHTPQFTIIDSPRLPGRSGAPRHAVRGRDRAQLRQEARAHRRHELRGRDQEVDLQHPQLHSAAAERAVDALLGQHRRGRRRRALLRPVGHRQDDALERSGSDADRRRRARLERSRRVQLRGRLLREDHPALGRGRAADLRDDAAVRHGARERRGRSRDARARSGRRPLHREHARRRIRSRSSTTRCRRGRAGIRATSSC